MKNLNAEQVKKDLQNIVDNYSGSWTRFNILSNALALINSQEQRIKGLAEEVESLGAEKEHLDLVVEGKLKRTTALEKQVRKLTEENERLKLLLKTDYINGTREHALSVIDQIAKEMLEGENEN